MLFSLSPLFVLLAVRVTAVSAFPRPAGDTKRTLDILARINSAGFPNLVAADQARARHLRSAGSTPNARARNLRRAASFAIDHAVVCSLNSLASVLYRLSYYPGDILC